MESLNGKAQDAEDDNTIYALANTGHAKATNSVVDMFHHSSGAVRVALMRAVANIPTMSYCSSSIYPNMLLLSQDSNI